MKKYILIIIGLLCFYNSNCFSAPLLKGLVNNELKVADEVEVAKNKEQNTNIELAKEKNEKNIESEKIENVISTENKTDNSKMAGVLADVKALSENKIESKIDNKMSAEANAIKNLNNKIEAKADFKTDVTGIKARKIDNALATLNETKNSKQKAENIVNNEGLSGKDALYVLVGISVLIGAIGAIFGKIYLKSNREKKLESAHEDLFEKVKVVSNKRNLLKSVAMKMKTESEINRQVLTEMFERYESKKFELGIEE